MKLELQISPYPIGPLYGLFSAFSLLLAVRSWSLNKDAC